MLENVNYLSVWELKVLPCTEIIKNNYRSNPLGEPIGSNGYGNWLSKIKIVPCMLTSQTMLA